jgi:membrane protein implicated in regulation of membrane protease activity
VSFARDGFTVVAIAALIALVMYAAALNRRSWALWLLAFALTIVALWIAYLFRESPRTGALRQQAVIAPTLGKVGRMVVTYSKEGEQVQNGPRMELR